MCRSRGLPLRLAMATAVAFGVLVAGGWSVSGQEIPLELHGTVVSETTRRPLSGVSVSIGPSSARVESAADGSYVIRDRQRSLNDLTGVQAILAGYLPEERFEVLGCHEVVVPQGERNPLCVVRLNFLMRPVSQVDLGATACNVSGRVVFEEDLAPAQVMITVDGTKIGTLTSADGRYLVLHVPAGLQRVTASGVGLITERRNVVVACEPGGEPVALSFMMRSRPVTDSE